MTILRGLDWDYTPPAGALGLVATELDDLPLAGFQPTSIVAHNGGPLTDQLPISEPAYPGNPGARAGSWADDFLERIHVTPSALNFGNIIGNAQRTVEIWNAYGFGLTLTGITQVNTDGLTITGQPAPPLPFGALQDRTFTINATPNGPPVAAASYLFTFSNGETRTVTISGRRIIAWQWIPDWQRGVMERLEFRTDLIRSFDAREQRRKIRNGARRLVEFDVLVTEADRRLLETAVGGWQGRTWALPLWWSGRPVTGAIAQGAGSIGLSTAGTDFQAGGLALILAQDGTNEVVEVQSIGGASITLARPTQAAWPATVIVFPATPARMDPSASLVRFNASASYARLRFTATEPATFTAAPPANTFITYPVLETRPLMAGDLTQAYARKGDELDNGIAPTVFDDEGGLGIFEQPHGWLAQTDAEVQVLRGLFYALAGRYGAVWIPTWTDDLTVVADIGSGATTIDVQSTSYTLYGAGQPGRNHIAIYRTNGSVSYHKVTGSSAVSATVERLTISPAAPLAIPVANVLRVSFLQLMRLSSDAVELMHWTGDTMEVVASFVSFRHDL